jgi:AraC-like DNA-binding protein
MKRPVKPVSGIPAIPEFFSAEVAGARRFYLNLSPPATRRLVVVCGGLERCNPDYAIHRDTFPFFSFEYVVRGSGTVTLKGSPCVLKPGRVFSYGPGVAHHIQGEAGDPLVKYFVDFAGTGAEALMKSCRLSPGSVRDVNPPHALQPLFDELIEVGLRIRGESAELSVKLLECLALRIDGASAVMKGAETLAFTMYEQCRQYIEKHALRLFTLRQIAAECHVSSVYLCRLYRRYDNQSPYQHLLRLKMNAAADRLRQPGVLIKQVAEEVGFDDPYHFSRVFRSVMGLSPAEFRRLR